MAYTQARERHELFDGRARRRSRLQPLTPRNYLVVGDVPADRRSVRSSVRVRLHSRELSTDELPLTALLNPDV